MNVKIVSCKPDGHAPLLKRGECAQDALHHVWHFHAPDGSRFASGGKGAKTRAVMLDDGTLVFTPEPPAFAWKGDVAVPNPWDIRNGEWIRTDENSES